MEADLLFTGIAISDLERSREWYERFFDRPADVEVNESEVMWRVAADIGWLYIVVDPDRVGRGLAALSVADLDGELASLRERGIVSDAIGDFGGGSRKATMLDPDGNVVALIQVPE